MQQSDVNHDVANMIQVHAHHIGTYHFSCNNIDWKRLSISGQNL